MLQRQNKIFASVLMISLILFSSMLDKTIFHMCELLDIRKGDKLSCITSILEFLLNPSAKIDPAIDPRWQPVVLLERIKIGEFLLLC